MYLFDTDTLSFILRPTSQNEALRTRFVTSDVTTRHASAITVAELLYGAERLAESRRRDQLQADIAVLLTKLTVVPCDGDTAATFARIKADLQRHGQPRADPDLMIAAAALTVPLILVTGNTAHFSVIPGLRCEDWIQR